MLVRMENSAAPPIVATIAGLGFDLSANMLPSYDPTAPHWIFAILFWGGLTLTFLPMPIWYGWRKFIKPKTVSEPSQPKTIKAKETPLNPEEEFDETFHKITKKEIKKDELTRRLAEVSKDPSLWRTDNEPDKLRTKIKKINDREEKALRSKRRIPLLQLRDLAESKGWDFSKMPKMNGREFVKELRQGGLDGKLTFFGRPKKYTVEELNMNEPLNEIASNHWKDYSINGLLHMSSDYEGKEENKNVESYRMEVMSSQEGRYIDLHVLEDKALSWLIEITNRYKD